MQRMALGIALVAIVVCTYVYAHAVALNYVSDRISNSLQSATSTHTIQFTATTAIPASGKIVITPQSGGLTIPASFDYTDVDFAVGSIGSYTDRTIAASASVGADGISVVTGSSGSITITLNSTTGISVGQAVQIELGTNATFGTDGDQLIVNQSEAGTVYISIQTKNAASTNLDFAKTAIAITEPVVLTAINQNIPPGRSNGLPSGTVAAGNEDIEISLNTDELAACNYALTPGLTYAAMPHTMNSVGGLLHTAVTTAHVNNTTYTYYVRCIDIYGTENTDDYAITFTLDQDPISNTSIIQTGASGQGGTGPFANGSSVLYLASIRFAGLAAPSQLITILKDGRLDSTTRARGDGSFEATVNYLERGVYSFGLYGTDGANRRSGTFTTTQFVSQGSVNAVTDVIIPPTLALESSNIGVGDTIEVTGQTVPGATVEIYLTKFNDLTSEPRVVSASSTKGVVGSPEGSWKASIDTTGLDKGAYRVRARTSVGYLRQSVFTGPLAVGVGEAVSVGGIPGDINGDGKVNLIDFSIMLSNWNTSNSESDFNSDGIVNLADFSILLFNWTG